MLCAAKADTFRTVFHRIGSISRCICIGTYLQLTVLVRPFHDTTEITAYGCFHCLDVAFINLTGGTVQGNIIALMELFSAELKYFILFIDGYIAASGHTCRTHTAGYHCCVGCHTAAYGQDTLRCMHTFDIFRRCLQTYQNNSLTFLMRKLRLFCGKIHFTCCRTR